MRELKRSIARHLMTLHGIEQINKKKFSVVKDGNDTGKRTSYFALHWREYLDPESKLNKQIARLAKRQRRRKGRFGFGRA